MHQFTRILFLVTSLALFLFSIFELYFFSETTRNNYWPTIHAAISITWLISLIKFSKSSFSSGLTFSTGFVFCLSIFHLSFIFLDAFSIYDFTTFFSSKTGTKYRVASSAVLLSLASFGIGIFVKTPNKTFTPPIPSNTELKKLFFASGIMLLFFAIIGFIMTLATVGNIFAYSRQDLFKGIGDTRGFGLFLMTFPSALVLLFVGARTTFIKMLTYPLVTFGALFLLFLGYRSNLFFPATVGACLWLKTGRKIPKSIFIGLVISALVIIPTVKYLRTAHQYSQISYEDIDRSLEKSETSETFLELGAILGLLTNVMDWIPEKYPYKYGLTYLKSLKTAIPNIGFGLTQNKRDMVKGMSNLEVYDALQPSDWYIYNYNKWMFNNGGGSGFSMIAEAYMNFGSFGFFLIFFLIGIMFSYFDSKDININPLAAVYIALLIWPIYYGVRNETGSIIKIFSFNSIIVFTAQKTGLLTILKRTFN